MKKNDLIKLSDDIMNKIRNDSLHDEEIHSRFIHHRQKFSSHVENARIQEILSQKCVNDFEKIYNDLVELSSKKASDKSGAPVYESLKKIKSKISESIDSKIKFLGSAELALADSDTENSILRDKLMGDVYLSLTKGEIPGTYTFTIRSVKGNLKDCNYQVYQGEKVLTTIKAYRDVNTASADYKGKISDEEIKLGEPEKRKK